MKDLLRDDLECKEIPSKPLEKDPYHHHIQNVAYFYRYVHQYLTVPTLKIVVQTFFLEKLKLKNILSIYELYICPKFCIGMLYLYFLHQFEHIE